MFVRLSYLTAVCILLAGAGSILHATVRAAQPAEPPTTQPATVKKSASGGNITLTVEMPAKLLSGERNILEILVKNNGESQLLDPGRLGNIELEVRHAGPVDHAPVPTTAFFQSLRESGTSSGIEEPLPKGETWCWDLDFPRYFDLSLPGNYEATVTWSYLKDGKPAKISVPLIFSVAAITADEGFARTVPTTQP